MSKLLNKEKSRQALSHRERVLTALSHRQPDRVPIDLGSTPVTGIPVKAYEKVKALLGLDVETRICHRQAQLAAVDQIVLDLVLYEICLKLADLPRSKAKLIAENALLR